MRIAGRTDTQWSHRHLLCVLPLLLLLLSSDRAWSQTDELPVRTADNLIVAFYNIQWIGQKTHDFSKLAEVIQHFDVCGIIEVRKERALKELALALQTKTGNDWGYCFGVRTNSHTQYHEAYGAVWRKDRVELGSGIVSGTWDWKEAFRNDPFLVSFKRQNFDFTLMLIHTRWTNDDDGTRANEVATLGEQINWYRGFLEEQDLILGGDFNYSGTHTAMTQMAVAAALKQIDLNEKSTFKSDNSAYVSSYDHIYLSAAFTTEFIPSRCRVMDTTKIVYGNNTTANMALSKAELSDHLPVWAEFRVTDPDDD